MFLVQIYPDSGMWEILVYLGDEITLIQIFSLQWNTDTTMSRQKLQ